eukprot:CAMPEP_0168624160 /NCGR_PEP_ID=MMETSP0449_2-20121227/9250_1 /TAXON_ID=1082188 /ORGANISM="Strombidium rassoulzadegani, Strain ras09" /LENGTH=115 /DNA_ID=CAMNT_0008665669 /DNA_START=195 /DNA_END=540 /DNA_ORIENTATION=-
MGQVNKYKRSRRFNKEASLFNFQLITEESQQSVVDLVMHGPHGKQFSVYCVVADQAALDIINRKLLSSKIKDKRLTIYAIQLASEEGTSQGPPDLERYSKAFSESDFIKVFEDQE